MAKSKGYNAPESTVDLSRLTRYYDPGSTAWKATSGSMPSNGISQAAYDAYAESRASSPYNSYGSSSSERYYAPSAQELYLEQYRKQQEEAAQRQQEALYGARDSATSAQRTRTDSALSQIASQQEGINRAADQSATQAYITREKAFNAMPQQQAYLGLSGGASESALLGLNTNFENSRNSIFQQRDDQIQNNINYQNQVRLEGDAALSDIENAYAMKDLDLLQRQTDAESQYAQMLYQAAQQQRQWEQEQAAAAERYERERQDYLSDLTDQRAYNEKMTEAERAYAQRIAAQKASADTKPTLSAKDAKTAWDEGYDTPEIRDAIESVYGNIMNKGTTIREIEKAYQNLSPTDFSAWLDDQLDSYNLTPGTYTQWISGAR